MNQKIVIELDSASIEKAIKATEQYKKWLDQKSKALAKRLAELGATSASLGFAQAFYDGPNDVDIRIRSVPNGYVVSANGEAALFIEFGAGITYSGVSHPEAAEYGMGPGTYPGKGHWDDPKGWYLPKAKQNAAGDKHSYGNPAQMPMYEARKTIEQNITEIVREVFASD